MTDFSITHEFETDPEGFWRVYLESAFQNEMYGSVGMKRSEVRRDDLGDRLVIVASYVAERQLPAVVRSVLGGKQLGYTETVTFHRARGEAEQQIVMNVMTDRIRFGGTIRLERLGDDHIRRTYAGAINVDIPLVGKKIEQSTVTEMKRTHEDAAKVTRAWLAKAAA
jgi:Protein of unknown function (DUF2505)